MLTIIFISIITSAIASFLVGRIYLNAQYHASNSGYRQVQVIKATREIAESMREKGSDIPEELIVKYRYSLAPLIVRMFYVFGPEEKFSVQDTYPALTVEGDPNKWLFFQEYIRPVKLDINNNAFIGWMPFVRNVQLMTALWDLCHIAENITMEIAAIETMASKKNIPLPYHIVNKKVILHPADHIAPVYNTHMANVNMQYGNLKRTWYKWLTLVNR